MYVGCNNATCSVTNSVFENNYIHHLRATSDGGNDGIEIKVGSYGNIVRNNVIHDTTIGKRFPGIFVYGGGAPANVVEGNVIWNAGEAIQVVSDAVIRNNLILNSDVGITRRAARAGGPDEERHDREQHDLRPRDGGVRPLGQRGQHGARQQRDLLPRRHGGQRIWPHHCDGGGELRAGDSCPASPSEAPRS